MLLNTVVGTALEFLQDAWLKIIVSITLHTEEMTDNSLSLKDEVDVDESICREFRNGTVEFALNNMTCFA